MANFLQNLLFAGKAGEEMFSAAAESSAETVAAVSANTENEAGEGDLDKFFSDYAEEQAVADAEAEAAREADRNRLIRVYAASFRDRILREIQNKDWDKLVRSYEKSSDEEDLLPKEVAILYNERISKVLPPAWWEKRAPELKGILHGDLGCYDILLQVVRSEVSQKANIKRQAAASNLLKQVKAGAQELGLSEDEFPHKPLGASETEAAAKEIGKKCLILATARAVRKNLLELRDQHVKLQKAAEQAFFLITDSRNQKWGVILMALCRLVKCWEALEEELCTRPGAPVEKLKKNFFSITLEERAIQVAGHCHLNVNEEVDVILASAGNKD